jgi:gliding motility-associated-like protein
LINTILKYSIFLFAALQGFLLKAHVNDSTVSAAGFIRNEGQWENNSRFLLNVRDAEIYLETHAFQYFFESHDDVAAYFNHSNNPHLFNPGVIHQHAVRMEFQGASPHTAVIGNKLKPHHLNFITGNDPGYWKSNVRVFAEVLYTGLYPGVDAKVYQGNESGLKYDFYIAAGADPGHIRMTYSGADRLFLKNGNLHIKTSVNSWVETKPYAFQRINGVPRDVECEFVINGNTVTFRLGDYDKNEVLVIDPQLIFSTYSGSSIDNFGHTATFDNSGNLYTAGIVRNPSANPKGRYPTTAGAFQTVWGGGTGSWPQQSFPCDIAISKYNNDGTELLYATYFGGNKNDYPLSLVVDDYQQLILLGVTLSGNFPVSSNGYDKLKSDSFDIVVSRFTPDGSALVGSTFFGGNGIDGINSADTLLMNYADEFRGEVQVTTNGDVIIVSSTRSTDLQTSPGAYQPAKSGMQDGVIARFDSALTTLKNCTYLGKSRHDALYSLDIDNAGNIVVAGGTQSTDFVPSAGFDHAGYRGGIAEGFVARFNSTLTSLLGIRYWGSPAYDQAYFVKLDPQQNVVVMGQTFDSISITPNTYNTAKGTIFITKFNPSLANIIFSTQIGNGLALNALSPSAFMVDICGRIYGSVWGGETNLFSRYADLHSNIFKSSTSGLPHSADALQPTTDGSDFWFFVLSPTADSLTYATFFGENGGADHVDGGTSRFDKRGIIYQSVCASCKFGPGGTFPTTPDSYAPKNFSDRCSNASIKLDFRQGNILSTDFTITPRNGCTDSLYLFKNKSYNGQKFYWYLNGTLADSSYNYSRVITVSGNYTMKLVAVDPTRCNPRDSIIKTFKVSPASNAKFSFTRDTCSATLFFKNESTVSNNEPLLFTWYFGDGHTSKDTNPVYRYADSGSYTVKLITSEGGTCADTATRVVVYDSLSYQLKAAFGESDTLKCEPAWIRIASTGRNGKKFYWYVNDVLVHTDTTKFDSIAQKGTYRIKLVVEDSMTCLKKDSAERVFTVLPETYTDFDWELDSCRLGVQFINQALILPEDTAYYFWDFGDGTFSTDSAPYHEYADTGTYMVEFSANKQFPCAHTTYKPVKVLPGNATLNASFSLAPMPLCEPDVFTANSKSINADKSYWYVNDVLKDSIHTSYSDSIKAAGQLKITLVVYNATTCRQYDTTEKVMQVYPSAVAAFKLQRDKCSPNLVFTNLSSSNSQTPVVYTWDFGDGQSSSDKDPVHEYDADGLYTITLITNGGTPCADTATQVVDYKKDGHLLNVDMLFTDSILCTPAIVHAIWTGINGKHVYWLLNDTLVSTDSIYRDTFTREGRFSIKLVVTDSNTCIGADTIERFVNISLFADAAFIMRRDSCSLDVLFENQSGSNSVPFIWYFGDGDSSSKELNPSHTYPKTDYYKVQLIYSPGTFCADTAEHIYYIDGDSSQEVMIPNVFTPNGDGVNDCYWVSGINTKCDEFYIKVYNRWGTVVYETTNSSACWDGTNQGGADIPQGVYYYIIDIKKKNGFKLTDHGTITLIRE